MLVDHSEFRKLLQRGGFDDVAKRASDEAINHELTTQIEECLPYALSVSPEFVRHTTVKGLVEKAGLAWPDELLFSKF